MSFLCSKGHRIKAENSAVNVDSLCSICKRLAREAQWRIDPFFAGVYFGGPTYHLDAVSRLERVKRFNTDQCRRALHASGLQGTVRQAIERRLRKLGGKP